MNINIRRISNSSDGECRFVFSFIFLLNQQEKNKISSTHERFNLALKKAKLINGRKYTAKGFSNYIVVTTKMSIFQLKNNIQKLNSIDL
jgi:hypothetical protein